MTFQLTCNKCILQIVLIDTKIEKKVTRMQNVTAELAENLKSLKKLLQVEQRIPAILAKKSEPVSAENEDFKVKVKNLQAEKLNLNAQIKVLESQKILMNNAIEGLRQEIDWLRSEYERYKAMNRELFVENNLLKARENETSGAAKVDKSIAEEEVENE